MEELIKANGAETMSSREIAELTGKRHDHVMRDCDKLSETYAKLGLPKVGESSYHNDQGRVFRELRLTKMQTMDLMTGYSIELRIRVNRRWEELEKKESLSPAEQLLQNAQLLVEQERRLAEHDDRIRKLEAKTTTRPDYFTVVGWAVSSGVKIGLTKAAQVGQKAARICRERGFPMDEVPDPRFGRVRSYPSDVLQEVFATTI